LARDADFHGIAEKSRDEPSPKLAADALDKTAVRAAAQKDAVAMDCLYATFDPKSSRPREIVAQVEALTANTQERATQYIRYNEALGGMAFELTPTTACE
jgi:hypothetical protein